MRRKFILRVLACLLALFLVGALHDAVLYEGVRSWKYMLTLVFLIAWLAYYAATGRTIRARIEEVAKRRGSLNPVDPE